ncbi:MAG: hypothetical protein WD886_01385 [Burkholderiales bacterium]
MAKPAFEIDVSHAAQSSLEAHSALATVDPVTCHHLSQKLRLPLGIYNVSIARMADRLISLCARAESYFKAADGLKGLNSKRSLRTELIDFMELAIYAAAEHVDDIDSIAKGFYRNTQKASKTAAYRTLNSDVKSHKRFLATVANAIKHQQSRIRLYSCEFRQPGVRGCLHGYFVEGVENGVVGPDKLLHTLHDVFSITSLPWEIITLVLRSSRSLRAFLSSEATLASGNADVHSERFSDAVVAAARLPLYTFGEEHPFARTTVTIKTSSGNPPDFDSGLYGSIRLPWTTTSAPTFGPDQTEFEGDGSTRTFRLAHPKSVAFQHWQ